MEDSHVLFKALRKISCCRCLASISDGDCSVVLKSAICRLFMETEFSNNEDVMRTMLRTAPERLKC